MDGGKVMQIHVVSRGDTFYSLARRYGVTPESIQAVNQLENPNQLVVGETLLIPTQNQYTVQPGDTLYAIAERFNVDLSDLIRLNPRLVSGEIRPGETVKIPAHEKKRIIVNGYLEPHEGVVERFREASSALTYLTIFSYHVQSNGTLIEPDPSENDLLAAVKTTRVQPLMAITNISEGGFDRDVATALFKSTDAQNRLIENVLRIMREKGYRGVNVDFEYLGSNTRRDYNRFIERLTNRLHRENFIVSTALAPKISGVQTGEWYEAHDYQFHGRTVDFVILMTYEWGWSGGPPMPVSPITQVRRVVNYARSVIPARKIVMSIPLYGYDWTLPFVEGGEFAKALNFQQAIHRAMRYNQSIDYNEREEAPFFRYTDENGKEHIVYFEDLRTMSAMFKMVSDLELGGISFWNLAFRFPAVWPMITDYFDVR